MDFFWVLYLLSIVGSLFSTACFAAILRSQREKTSRYEIEQQKIVVVIFGIASLIPVVNLVCVVSGIVGLTGFTLYTVFTTLVNKFWEN